MDNLRMVATGSLRITAPSTSKSPVTPTRHGLAPRFNRSVAMFIIAVHRCNIRNSLPPGYSASRPRVSLKV